MKDARWPLLKEILLKDGWSWKDDNLHAPHGTMWFKQDHENADYAEFRDAMSETLAEVSQEDLHADLVSLVGALDLVLRGN